MKSLLRAIEMNDCFLAAIHIADIFQPNRIQLETYTRQLQVWSEQALQQLSTRCDANDFQRLLKFFYVDLAFSGDEEHYFACKCNLINQVMDYRTGIQVTLSTIFQALANRVGFDVVGVNFPGHFLLKAQFLNTPSVFIDPLTGKCLSHADLHHLYFSILTEIEGETMPSEALEEASCGETVVRMLHNLKAAYISEKSYSNALKAVQLLVDLCPNDPYERRDRGFLLHQLDCTEVAIADYQYFIRQCPDDPSTQLLQAQLQQLSSLVPQVFH